MYVQFNLDATKERSVPFLKELMVSELGISAGRLFNWRMP